MTDTDRLDFLANFPDLVHQYRGTWSWSRRMSMLASPSLEPPYPDPQGHYHDIYTTAGSLREAIDLARVHQLDTPCFVVVATVQDFVKQTEDTYTVGHFDSFEAAEHARNEQWHDFGDTASAVAYHIEERS